MDSIPIRRETVRNKLNAITPKKCFCGVSLKSGSKFIAIFFAIIHLIILLVVIVQAVQLAKYRSGGSGAAFVGYPFAIRNSFGYTIVAVVYTAGLVLLQVWFFWGVAKDKTSVILSWCVIMLVWLVQLIVLLLALIFIYSTEVGLAVWVICLVLTVLIIALFGYLIMVPFGLYLHIKGRN